MKKLFLIIISFFFVSFSYGQEIKKYMLTTAGGEVNFVDSKTIPKEVVFDSRLTNEENKEVILKGEVKKETMKSNFPKRGAYSLTEEWKYYEATNDQGKVSISKYDTYLKHYLSWTLVFIGSLFFFGFFFLKKYGTKVYNADQYGDETLMYHFLLVIAAILLMIGMIALVVSSIVWEKVYFSYEMLLIDFSLFILGIVYWVHKKAGEDGWSLGYKEHNRPWAIIVLFIIVAIAYWIGEDLNFLLFNIFLPAFTGYLLSFYFFRGKKEKGEAENDDDEEEKVGMKTDE